MEQQKHYFPGGNTGQGFFNRFSYILPREQVRRKIILKGGPGVGKSTLIRRVAEKVQEMGRPVELFHCSSDPDSLDALAVPSLGLAIMDGTAPHVVDPVLPGAEDGILNLGECLSEELLEKSRRTIRDAMEEISQCFLRAYDYLGAAAPLLFGSARDWKERMPAGSVEALAKTLIAKWLPEGEGRAAERELFAEAHTPRGFLSFLPTVVQARVACVASPWGLSPHPLLAKIRDAALERGIPVLGLYHPLLPMELSHLDFPTLSFSIVTGPVESPWETVNLQEALSLSQGLSREQAFNRNAHELLLQRATESLKEAKSRHDELERFYTAAMDYARWEKALEKVMETVEGLAGGAAPCTPA